MKVITTVPFVGVPDGQAHGKQFEVGDEVLGDLANVALTEKWAKEVKEKIVEAEKSVEKMSVDELKTYADERKIDISAAKNAAEILAAIKAAAK